jgi:hypothetical protein
MVHIKRSFAVSLSITHPSMDPGAISSALALMPSQQTKVGSSRVTPGGVSLKGTYLFSSWGHRFDVRDASDLSECLVPIVERLEAHRLFFQGVVRDGGTIELFCGIFADGNWDESLHHSLLRRLSDLGIDLRLDVYPNHDEIA